MVARTRNDAKVKRKSGVCGQGAERGDTEDGSSFSSFFLTIASDAGPMARSSGVWNIETRYVAFESFRHTSFDVGRYGPREISAPLIIRY